MSTAQVDSLAGGAVASPAELSIGERVIDKNGAAVGAGETASPPPYPATFRPPGFPIQCVYDPLIAVDDYVDETVPNRAGVLFKKVPSGPLKPALIPAHADGSKTFFYVITVGLKVGIVTDAAIAAANVNGVSGAFSKKRHSQSAALQYFNEDLAAGKVKIGSLRKSSRPLFLCDCIIA